MKKKLLRRGLSIILVLTFLIACIPCTTVFAEEAGISPMDVRNTVPVKKAAKIPMIADVGYKGDIVYSYQMDDVALNYSNEGGWKFANINSIDYNPDNQKYYWNGQELYRLYEENNIIYYSTKEESYNEIKLYKGNNTFEIKLKTGGIQYYDLLPKSTDDGHMLRWVMYQENSSTSTSNYNYRVYNYITNANNEAYLENIEVGSYINGIKKYLKSYLMGYQYYNSSGVEYSDNSIASGTMRLQEIYEGKYDNLPDYDYQYIRNYPSSVGPAPETVYKYLYIDYYDYEDGDYYIDKKALIQNVYEYGINYTQISSKPTEFNYTQYGDLNKKYLTYVGTDTGVQYSIDYNQTTYENPQYTVQRISTSDGTTTYFSNYKFENPVYLDKNNDGNAEFQGYLYVTEKNNTEKIKREFWFTDGYSGQLARTWKYFVKSSTEDILIDFSETQYGMYGMDIGGNKYETDTEPVNDRYFIYKTRDMFYQCYGGDWDSAVYRQIDYSEYDYFMNLTKTREQYCPSEYIETDYAYNYDTANMNFGTLKTKQVYQVKNSVSKRKSYERYYYNNSNDLENFNSLLRINTKTEAAKNPGSTDNNLIFRTVSESRIDGIGNVVKKLVSIDKNGNKWFVNYGYRQDVPGLVESITQPNSSSIAQTFEYDEYLRQIVVLDNKTKSKVVTAYDNASRVIRKTEYVNNREIKYIAYEYNEYDNINCQSSIRSYDDKGQESIQYFDAYGRLIQEKSRIEDLPDGTLQYNTIDHREYIGIDHSHVVTSEVYVSNTSDYTGFDESKRISQSEFYFEPNSNSYYTRTVAEDGTESFYKSCIENINNIYVPVQQTYWVRDNVMYLSEKIIYNNMYNITKEYYNENEVKVLTESMILNPINRKAEEVSTTDPDTGRSITKSAVYDGLGNCSSITDTVAGSTSFTYDKNRNVETKTDANGQTVYFEYDILNRLNLKTYPDGSFVEYRYDEAGHGDSFGRATSISYGENGQNTDEFYYDLENQKTKVTRTIDGITRSMESSQDQNQESINDMIQYPDGEKIWSYYNRGGELRELSSIIPHASYDYIIKNIDYSKGNIIDTITYGNDTKIHYSYDNNNRLDGIEYLNSSDQGIGSMYYSYYGNTSLIERIDEPGEKYDQSFTYDLLNRLDTATNNQIDKYGTRSFTYDNFDNILSKDNRSYQYYDPQFMNVQSDGISEYTYDNCGNIITENSNSNTKTYNYDGENRLTSVVNSAEQPLMQAGYDYNGQRIKKTDANGKITYYFFPQYQERYNSDGTVESVTKKYFALGRQVAMKINNEMFYMYQDHLNSLRMLTDGNGTVTGTYYYAPDGELIDSWSDRGLSIDQLYTGQELDGVSSLYYYNARYYKQSLGRFITPDSVIDGVNSYAYCRNNPIVLNDPTGNTSIGDWFKEACFDFAVWNINAWKDASDWCNNANNDASNWIDNAWDDASKWCNKNSQWIGLGISAAILIGGACVMPFCPVLGEAMMGAGIEGLVYSATHDSSEFNALEWVACMEVGALFGGALRVAKTGLAAAKYAKTLAQLSRKQKLLINIATEPAYGGIQNYLRCGITDNQWSGDAGVNNIFIGMGVGLGTAGWYSKSKAELIPVVKSIKSQISTEALASFAVAGLSIGARKRDVIMEGAVMPAWSRLFSSTIEIPSVETVDTTPYVEEIWNLGLKIDTNKALKWHGFTFIPCSYQDNGPDFALAVYDYSGNFVGKWQKSDQRYINNIIVDTDNRTVSFPGQVSTPGEITFDKLMEFLGYYEQNGNSLPEQIYNDYLNTGISSGIQWKFNENKGSVAMDTKVRNEGVLSPGAMWANGAIRIDGTNESFVNFGNEIDNFGTGDFTVSFWLKTTETSNYFDLIGDRTSGSHGNFISVRMTGSGSICAEVDENDNGLNYIGIGSSESGLNNGSWHHVAIVRNNSSLKLYIDGNLSAQGSSDGVANIYNANDFKIGRSLEGYTDKFAPDAMFDDTRIIYTSLTDNDIRILFNNRQ